MIRQQHHRRSGSLVRWLAWSMMPCLLIAGCAAAPGGDPVAALRRSAQRESPRPPALPPAPPPGISARAVLAGEDPQAAAQTLAEALDALRRSESAIVDPPQVVATGPDEDREDRRSEALRAYLRGRAALLELDAAAAVAALEHAHRLDPAEPRILRQLGRAHAAAGSSGRASEAFRRLRGFEPDDIEAIFTIGMNHLARREWRPAAAALARFLELAGTGPDDATPATRAAAEFGLASALLELRLDRAFLEVAPLVLAIPLEAMLAGAGEEQARLGELYRRRVSIVEGIGDARLRLGDADGALVAYREALSMPLADPRPLQARVLHALLVAGRPRAAALQLVDWLADPIGTGDAEVSFARHLVAQGVEPGWLVPALLATSRARPEDPLPKRVLAAVDSEAALELLVEAVASDPAGDGIEQLLGWLEAFDLEAAVAVVVDLVGRNPDALERAVDRLVATPAPPRELRGWIERLPPTPAREAVRAMLLVRMGDPIAAWARLDDGVNGDPLRWKARVAAAGALRDSSLLGALERVPPAALDEGTWRVHLAEQWLAAGAPERAWVQIDALPLSDSGTPRSRGRMLLVTSRVAAAEAVETEGPGVEVWRQLARRSAAAAIEADPTHEAAWSWSLALHDPRSGALPDADLHRRLVAAAVAELGDRPLAERIRTEQALAAGRVEEAVERLEALLSRQPADDAALQALMGVLARGGRAGEVLSRLAVQIERVPADPRGWEQWLGAMVRSGRSMEAQQRLEALLIEDPAHPFAGALQAAVGRTTGRGDASEAWQRERIARRPATPARDLEEAQWWMQRAARLADPRSPRDPEASSAAAAAFAEAVDRIARLLPDLPGISRGERWRALNLLLLADAGTPGRSEALAGVAEAVLASDPGSPLAVHGAALLASRLRGEPIERFRERVLRAARSPQGRGLDEAAAARWLGIAERVLEAGDVKGAVVLLETVLDELPVAWSDGWRRVVAATIALDARIGGRADESAARLDRLQQAGRLRPGDALLGPEAPRGVAAGALFEASNIYNLVGDQAGAIALLERVVAQGPDAAIALNNLGYARLEDGLLDERTEALLERAHALQPADPSILDSLGWLRYRQGRLEEGPWGPGSVALLAEAVKQSGDAPSLEGLDHLGDALWRAGRSGEAVRQWQRVLAEAIRRFDREQTIRGVEAFQRQAFGLVVVDPLEFHVENHQRIVDRARAKLRQVTDREEPAVAAMGGEGAS